MENEEEQQIKKIKEFLTHAKRYGISSLVTFAATFILSAGIQLIELPTVEWGKAAFVAVLGVAVRAGLKVAVEKFSGKLTGLEL